MYMQKELSLSHCYVKRDCTVRENWSQKQNDVSFDIDDDDDNEDEDEFNHWKATENQ
jgi:hypothetical protein